MSNQSRYLPYILHGLAIVGAIYICVIAQSVYASDLGTIDAKLGDGLHAVKNFAGDDRYVLVSDREVKLFLSNEALNYDNPKIGFSNDNHFKDSCAPTAAMNVFKWYGIDKLAGNTCFWMKESAADVQGIRPPPIWVCRPKIMPHKLGRAMKTNTWRVATITMPGTNTTNFRKVFKSYLETYKPSKLKYQYAYEEGDGRSQYQMLWKTLAQGNPVVVTYKTGATKGHFATIVGIEKVGNDDNYNNDKIFLANPRKEDQNNSISWNKFRLLWRRDYNDFGALKLVGERRYSRINLWDSTAVSPLSGGSGKVKHEPVHKY